MRFSKSYRYQLWIYLPLTYLVCFLSDRRLGNLAMAEPLKGANVRTVIEGKYSYVVSIASRNDSYHAEKLHFCTGVLITKEFVLTAAHCFTGRLLGDIQLIIGSVDLREGKKYDPSMWITYNLWAESKNITKKYAINDIAMIKLSGKVSSRVAKPARLSNKKHNDLCNEPVKLVGWGMTDMSPDRTPRYLQEVKVKILPNKICENIAYHLFKYKITIYEKYLCTKGEPHAFLAHGDSGAPVVRKNSVVGISRSTCPKMGICDLPETVINAHKLNIHASIDFYRIFITDVLKNY